MSNFKIIPDGNLINFDNVTRIEVEDKKVFVRFIGGFVVPYTLDDEWREILKNLAKEGDK